MYIFDIKCKNGITLNIEDIGQNVSYMTRLSSIFACSGKLFFLMLTNEAFRGISKGAKALSQMTFNKMTFNKMTFSQMTFSQMTLSQMTFSQMTLSQMTFSKMTFSYLTFSNLTFSKMTFSKVTFSITLQNVAISRQCYKTFYGFNLRIFVMS